MGQRMPGDRALFGLLGRLPDGTGETYLFRCPVCDTCTSTEADTPCSSVCAGLARSKSTSKRRAGGGGRG